MLKTEEERKIIKNRYLFGFEWMEILPMVYSKREDYPTKTEKYRRKMFRAHESALEKMGRMWSIKKPSCE